MLNADILWFGPNLHNAIARKRIYSSLEKHCGEETERFNAFGMIHNAPRRDEFIFFVGNRLFFGLYVDQSLLVIEDHNLNDYAQVISAPLVQHSNKNFQWYDINKISIDFKYQSN